MAINSESSTESCLPHDEINLLDLFIVLARRWRMIASITGLAAIGSAAISMTIPIVYASTAKLLVLNFEDQTQVLRVGNDGRLVFGEKKGVWKAADVSIIKEILESSQLSQVVESKLKNNYPYRVSVKLEKQPGVISVNVEGRNRETMAAAAAAITEEGARLAFNTGLLASPALVLGDVPKYLDGAVTVARLLQAPTNGTKIKPKRDQIVLLSTVTGLLCSIFLAFVLEYFRNLNDGDRVRLGEIRAALRGNSADKKSSEP